MNQTIGHRSPTMDPLSHRQSQIAAPGPKRSRTTCRSALAFPSANAATVFAADRRPIILFDGVCNLCNGGVRFAVENDPDQNLRFAALQSNIGKALLQRCGRKRDDISSIVLVTPDSFHIKSEAILKIGQSLRQPFPALAAPLFTMPSIVRDAVYDQIAGNRYNIFGKQDACQLYSDQGADRFLQ